MMDFIQEKTFTLTLSIFFLGLGVMAILKTDLVVMGVFITLGSFFMFNSCFYSSINQFVIGQICLYSGMLVFYLKLVLEVPMVVNVLFILSFWVAHQSLRYVLKLEYE